MISLSTCRLIRNKHGRGGGRGQPEQSKIAPDFNARMKWEESWNAEIGSAHFMFSSFSLEKSLTLPLQPKMTPKYCYLHSFLWAIFKKKKLTKTVTKKLFLFNRTDCLDRHVIASRPSMGLLFSYSVSLAGG